MKLATLGLALIGLIVGLMAYIVIALMFTQEVGLVAVIVGLSTSIAGMFSGAWGKEHAVSMAAMTAVGLIVAKFVIAGLIGGSDVPLPRNFQITQQQYDVCMADADTWANKGGKDAGLYLFLDSRKHYWYAADVDRPQPGDAMHFENYWQLRLENWDAERPSFEDWKSDLRKSPNKELGGFGPRLKDGFSFFNILMWLAAIAAAYFSMALRKAPVNIVRTTKTNSDGYHEIK